MPQARVSRAASCVPPRTPRDFARSLPPPRACRRTARATVQAPSCANCARSHSVRHEQAEVALRAQLPRVCRPATRGQGLDVVTTCCGPQEALRVHAHMGCAHMGDSPGARSLRGPSCLAPLPRRPSVLRPRGVNDAARRATPRMVALAILRAAPCAEAKATTRGVKGARCAHMQLGCKTPASERASAPDTGGALEQGPVC